MRERTIAFQIPLPGFQSVRAAFDCPPISNDGGLSLVRHVDAKLGFLARLGRVFGDRRDRRYTKQPVADLFLQRVLQIIQGYEDCNDAKTLRHDPMFKVGCGRHPVVGQPLASQPTLSRFENSADSKACYRLSHELLESYFDRHPQAPRELILDIDTTDDPTHGQQELSAFHAFYDNHVYLPLLIFDQNGDLLVAALQPGKPKSGKTAAAILERVILTVRRHWPETRIMVRGDSAFASGHLYWMCHRLGVDFLLGIQPNPALKRHAIELQERARRRFLACGEPVRIFSSFRYRASSRKRLWPRSYRIVMKAEHSALGANLRFVVTNLPGRSDELYDRYVQRGESCENSIKDLKNALKADRLSCHRFWPNQFRLLLHAAGYVLLHVLRRYTYRTELATAQMDTIRQRLLKVATHVTATARTVALHFSRSHPWQEVWLLIAARVTDGPLPA